MIQEAARDFAQTELLPGVIERDNNKNSPDELVKKMGDLVLWELWLIQNTEEAEWIATFLCN